jgi:hypothetical protein
VIIDSLMISWLLIVDLRLGAEARVHEHAASPIADNGTISD